MAIKFEKIVAGMTLYDVRKPSGNQRRFDPAPVWWPMEVKEVDAEQRRALVRSYTGRLEWVPERRLTKLRVKKAEKE